MLCGRTRCLRPRIPDVGRLDVFTDLPFLSWGWHDPFDRQQHSQKKVGQEMHGDGDTVDSNQKSGEKTS